jgi:ubiquinol-cytochrome c reductase cytochrome c1 subunit
MTKARSPMRRISTILFGLVVSATAFAAGGHGGLLPANTQVDNKAMLQRGAGLYMNYCAGCHSLKYLRYSRLARDLGLSEELVMENLVFSDTAKFNDTIQAAMGPADGARFFGKLPPDLSLSARVRGVDWLYTYLKSFYSDPGSATGWNNSVLVNASMPHVLWELQGVQAAHYAPETAPGAEPVVESLELVKPGLLSPAEYDAAVRDLVTFLEYAAEPAILKRQGVGVWVLLYLALFTVLAWLLKKEYWKDVH